MNREVVDEDVGSAEINPKTAVPVGEKGTWRITYRAGRRGLDNGGSVRITIPHGFSLPQIKAFFDPGFTTIKADSLDLEFELDVVTDIFCRWDTEAGHSGAWGRSVFVHNIGRKMEEGETFTLIYGNQDYYGGESFIKSGSWTRELSGKAEFTVAVDPDGERGYPYSGYAKIRNQPFLMLDEGREIRRMGFLPADVYADETIIMSIISVDAFNNPRKIKDSDVTVMEDFIKLDEEMSDGWVPIRMNPVRIHDEEAELKLFWGDPHGHTIHSDGLGTLDDYYKFAQNISCLDFTAVTDHDDIGPKLSQDEWELTKRVANRYYKPGEFTSFIGHEYRNDLCDMNVYYPGKSGELLCHTEDNLNDAAVLTEQVKKNGGMIVPHMHFGADWSGFDPEVYRVIEVYSQHGSAEYPGCPREIPYLRKQVQKSSKTNEDCYIHDALKQGFRMGFIAGSDTHSGRPGFSDWTRVCRTYFCGLTAVFATECTREAIWEALYSRHCYATTGNRSILEFEINGRPMGSEISIDSGTTREIYINCKADGQLYGLKIFRSGKIWIDEKLYGQTVQKKYTDKNRTRNDWYYARLDLNDGEMVWSSPIWIDVD